MGVRISRIIGSVFNSTGVQSKSDDTERDAQQRPHYEQNPQDTEQERKLKEDALDAEKVAKAVEDLKNSKEFSGTGITIETVRTKFGFQVRLSQADGTLLRVMTAEEFLRLKATSSEDSSTRGKLVDQKF